MRDHTSSTEMHLFDSRFHRAALLSNPETLSLADAVLGYEQGLRTARGVREEKEELEMVALAALYRIDFDYDEKIREAELAVFAKVKKKRDNPSYKRVFPKGLMAVTALRGADQQRTVSAMLTDLLAEYPEIHATYGADLTSLGDQSVQAETAYLDAVAVSAQSFGLEVAARTALVRQLYKNEGALLGLFPRQRAKVRTFFRPSKKAAKKQAIA